MKKVVLAVFICVFAVGAWADSGETGAEKTLSPYFHIDNEDDSADSFPLKDTGVSVNISGVIADVVVTQKYGNEGTRPINGRYIFPGSTRAAVHGMTMRIGEKIIHAKIKEKKEAKRIFNSAKKAGKSASLLEQKRPNVFSMSVANIMPGDLFEVELRYTELLVPTDGIYEFVYPTVVGPRYSGMPAAGAPESEKWVQNPYLKKGGDPKTSFSISVNLSTGIPVHEVICKTHQTNIDYEGESLARISLADPSKFGGDRDFILNYRLTGKQIESGLMLYAGEDENFFLAMVQPPERVELADIPKREYIFIVDVSGSMHGFPLNTSKALLKNLIGNLRETDKFNLILFAGASKVMSPSSVPATAENIDMALRVIERETGGGGTELLSALKRGMKIPRDENFSRTAIIVTDGFIHAEKEVFKEIQQNLDKTNVFAFGIGSGVNRYLIEGIAKSGLGEPFVVTKPSEADGTAEKFREYVQSPVLTGMEMTYENFETYDVEPMTIPDVFAERPVIVFGKWRGEPGGTVRLAGTGGSGEYVEEFDVSETKPLDENRALKYLWARSRLARLSDFNTQRKNPENRLEIVSLGLTYNLLTAHTSFVAVDDVVRNHDVAKTKDVTQPLTLPKGVSNRAVGGSKGGTSSQPEMLVAKVTNFPSNVPMSNAPEPGLMLMLALLAPVLAKRMHKRLTGRKG